MVPTIKKNKLIEKYIVVSWMKFLDMN